MNYTTEEVIKLTENKKKTEIDQRKLNRLKYNLFRMERENLKTKKYRQYQMNERVRKAIEREVLD